MRDDPINTIGMPLYDPTLGWFDYFQTGAANNLGKYGSPKFDDLLRQVPSFSLFRRSSSLVTHPTAQGVSLRGVGPSGVSRTLVLIDSVPFNDPFGGWVYWTRVPLDSVDRIEVVDGSSSILYGNYAMGGVINIVTNQPARRTFEIKPQYGNKTSPKVDCSRFVWRLCAADRPMARRGRPRRCGSPSERSSKRPKGLTCSRPKYRSVPAPGARLRPRPVETPT